MKNLLVAVFSCVAGCDLPEGEVEERREVSAAVERGAPPEKIQRQLQDVGDTIAKSHAEGEEQLHRSLDELEVRIAMLRQQGAEGRRQPSVELEVALVEISGAAAQARQALREPSERPAARRQEEMRREIEILQQRLDQLSSITSARSSDMSQAEE
jgi:Mg2+ and Co2+ transporter CorA